MSKKEFHNTEKELKEVLWSILDKMTGGWAFSMERDVGYLEDDECNLLKVSLKVSKLEDEEQEDFEENAQGMQGRLLTGQMINDGKCLSWEPKEQP